MSSVSKSTELPRVLLLLRLSSLPETSRNTTSAHSLIFTSPLRRKR